MIQATSLSDDLDSKMWTVFAPTNLAFEKLPMDSIEYLMVDASAMTSLLLFHITGSGPLFHSFDWKCDGELVMANGDVTTTLCNNSNSNNNNDTSDNATNTSRVWYQVGAGNMVPPFPQIIMADLPACNGIVHVIDQVLLFEYNVTTTTTPVPTMTSSSQVDEDDDETTDTAGSDVPSGTPSDRPIDISSDSPTNSPSENNNDVISDEPSDSPSDVPTTTTTTDNTTSTSCSATLADVVCGRDDLFTLCTALMVMAELDQLLTIIDTTSNFTLFAPNNEAFDKLGDTAVNYLLQPSQHELLASILLFHFVPDLVLSLTDLICVAGPDSLLTMGNGYESRTVCQTPFIYQKGAGNEPDSRRPEIVKSDIMDACNGELRIM
jgi:transforming growth factor-beta-induced protein